MSTPVKYHYGNFPPQKINWEKLIPLIGPASAALTRYDGILSVIPNPGILLAPLTTQEAVLSSKIEGTQTTMGEVLEFEAEKDDNGFDPEKKADIYEVLNYRKAIRAAIDLLKELPLCIRVIREAHKVLNGQCSRTRQSTRRIPKNSKLDWIERLHYRTSPFRSCFT